MPFRRIILSDGREASRNITDVHPNGEEFLPEEFAVLFDSSERVSRVYDLLSDVIRNISAGKIK